MRKPLIVAVLSTVLGSAGAAMAEHHTTLSHVAIHFTSLTPRPTDNPGVPYWYNPFSCATNGPIGPFASFSSLAATAVDEDTGEVGELLGTLAVGPGNGAVNTFVIAGEIRFLPVRWDGFIQGPAAYSCTETPDGIILRVSGLIGVAATGGDPITSSGFPCYVDGEISYPYSVRFDAPVSVNLSLYVASWDDPAGIVLDPAAANADPGSTRTMTATVRDFSPGPELPGSPVADVPVMFNVTGAVSKSGVCTTDAAGQCAFSYQGPAGPGVDRITAFADTNGDGVNNPERGEPLATGSTVWGDTQPPSITAPPDVTVAADPGTCGATLSSAVLGTATATDDVAVASITRSPAGSLFPAGVTTVTWTATDSSGNTASAQQHVTVVDGESPSLVAPPDVSVLADSASGTVLPPSARGSATVADNCAGATVSVAGAPAGDLFPIGSTTLTWIATDAAGNTSTANQQIVVSYRVCALYDATKAKRLGSTFPIKLQLCSASGLNLSGANLLVHATNLAQISGTTVGVIEDSGQANPDLDFRYDAGSYVFNLSTKGLTTGTWRLAFTVSGETSPQYWAEFQIR